MTNDQHSQERQQDDDRWRWAFGILLTILLFLAAQAVIALIWGGRITAHVEAAQQDITDTRRALDEALSRVGALETGRATAASEITGLRRDFTEWRAEQRQESAATREELQSINEYLQRIYRNGNQ